MLRGAPWAFQKNPNTTCNRLSIFALRDRSGAIRVADIEALEPLALNLARRCQGPATQKYRGLGTVSNLLVLDRLGALPTRNYRETTFEGAE